VSDVYIQKPSLLSNAELQRLYMFLAVDEDMLEANVVFKFQLSMEINADQSVMFV
jgi:hypothetical protein